MQSEDTIFVNTPMDETQLEALEFVMGVVGKNLPRGKCARTDAIRVAVLEYAKQNGWTPTAPSIVSVRRGTRTSDSRKDA